MYLFWCIIFLIFIYLLLYWDITSGIFGTSPVANKNEIMIPIPTDLRTSPVAGMEISENGFSSENALCTLFDR